MQPIPATGAGLLSGDTVHAMTRLPLSPPPTAVVTDFGAVWTADPRGFLVRLDPATGRHVSRIRLAEPATSLVAGELDVWAVEPDRIERINPVTDRVEGVVAMDERPVQVAEGDSILWIAGPNVLEWADRSSGTTQGLVVPPARRRAPIAVAFGAGTAWVLYPCDSVGGGTIARQGRVGLVATIPFAGCPTAMTFADGSLYVAATDGTITRIDPRTDKPAGEIYVEGFLGGLPTDLVAGEVIAGSSRLQILLAVDQRSRRVIRLDLESLSQPLHFMTYQGGWTFPGTVHGSAVGLGKAWFAVG